MFSSDRHSQTVTVAQVAVFQPDSTVYAHTCMLHARVQHLPYVTLHFVKGSHRPLLPSRIHSLLPQFSFVNANCSLKMVPSELSDLLSSIFLQSF